MTGGICRVLGNTDGAQINLGDQQALLIRRQLLADLAAVGAIDRGKASAGMQQRMLIGPIAEFVDHGLRHRRARREHEAGALHGNDAAPTWLPYPADVNALIDGLWSRTTVRGADGALEVGGVSVHRIAEEVGTAVLVVDELAIIGPGT